MKNNFGFLKILLPIAFFAFLLHYFCFYYFKTDTTNFIYSLLQLYLVFAFFSIIILKIVHKVSEKSFENTGMTFILASSVKLVIAYLLLKPVFANQNNTEKYSFLFVFILFFLLENGLTMQLLNKKK